MKPVIKRADGGVSIVTLVGDADLDEVLAKWQSAHPGEYVSHREMEDSAIPTDRTYREAWTDTTPEPIIDIDADKVSMISAKAAAVIDEEAIQTTLREIALADTERMAASRAAIMNKVR
jgi:hypothetical protein